MNKIIAIAAVSIMLAGCATTGRDYINVASVDASGNVVIERVQTSGPASNFGSMESISCYNPATGKFRAGC